MNFKLSELGSIQKDAEQARVDFATAVFGATWEEGERAQKLHREAILKSGIKRAPAMAKTWRVVMRPRQARPGELRVAAIVFNRSPVFTRYLAEEGVARPKSARALVVPVGRAAKLKLPVGVGRRQLLARAREAFGEMFVATLKDGRQALCVTSAKGRIEPLFLLLKEVQRRRRVDPDRLQASIDRAAPARWRDALARHWDRTASGARQGAAA